LSKITPFITGSVVQGGWKKHLKMLRSELFSTACLSNSKKFIDHCNKCKFLKKGIVTYAEQNQDITEEPIIRKT